MKIFLAALLLQSGLGVAQNIANDTIKEQEINEILVLSEPKVSMPYVTPFPMESVNKEQIAASSFFTPADALQRKAGVSLVRDGVWATSVNVRGLSKERLLMLANGERIQTATDVAAALSTVDVNTLERIDVIKGAASVLYGTGAMGGVINFVSEKPFYTEKREVHGKINTGFNTVNSLWASHAAIQLSENNWYVAANGSYRTANDLKTPVGTLENSQFNDASYGIMAGLIYDDTHEVLVNYQHYEAWNVGIPGGPFSATAKVRYRNVTRNQLSAEYIITEPIYALNEIRFKAYTQNISREVESYEEAKRLTLLPSSENVTSGGKILTDWDLGLRHNLYVGAEGWYRDATTKRYKIVDDATVPNKYTVTGEQPVPESNMLDLGIFGQYSWKIHPRKLQLDAGLRLDFIQTNNDSAYDPVFRYTMENGHREDIILTNRKVLFVEDTNREFSYAAHLDLIYRPANRHKLALSLSNAYRAASLEERFKFIDVDGKNVRTGSPGLKPEKGLFSNLAYTFSGNKFRLTTDIYANYLFDLIAEQKVATTALKDTFKYVNVDEALLLGAELEMSYHFTPHFWSMANVAYTYTQDLTTEKFLPQIPPVKGLVELNYRYPRYFVATLSGQWAAKQSQVAEGEDKTDGYFILNFGIRSEKIKMYSSAWQFFAGMDNILDTEYYNHLTTTRTGVRIPEAGRNIYAKVQFSW